MNLPYRLLCSALRIALAAALLIFSSVPASAAVEITFYDHQSGGTFPHAFVALSGTPERGGARISTNYGFTATHVSPAVLFGPVAGKLDTAGTGYVRGAEAHFAVSLTDAELDAVTAVVERYRALPQPAYSLGRRNCIHFVAEVAAALGMSAEVPGRLTRRPRSFLDYLVRRNRQWLAARPAARILRDPPSGDDRRRD